MQQKKHEKYFLIQFTPVNYMEMLHVLWVKNIILEQWKKLFLVGVQIWGMFLGLFHLFIRCFVFQQNVVKVIIMLDFTEMAGKKDACWKQEMLEKVWQCVALICLVILNLFNKQ